MRYRKDRLGCSGYFAIIIFFMFTIACFFYIGIFAIAIWLIYIVLIAMRGLTKYIYRQIKESKAEKQFQREMQAREVRLQEERAERIKQQEIERNAMKRNAELKYQDEEDNYKHYLDLHK